MYSSLLSEGDYAKESVKPEDSISQVTVKSSTSSTASAHARAVAKRAGLQAKLASFKRLQKLELDRKLADLEIRQAELEGDLQAAAAEEHVLNEYMEKEEDRSGVNRKKDNARSSQDAVYLSDSQKPIVRHKVELNPYAHEWSVSHVANDNDVKRKIPSWQQLETNSTPIEHPTLSTQSIQSNDTPHTGQLQQQMIDLLSLPKTSLKPFDGDPMQFSEFMNSFDSSVDRSSVDDSLKLNRLLEYCVGRAAKVIKPCALMSPQAGYRRARELLKERFGNQYQISEAWLKKVTGGPAIKATDGTALQDLADDLRCCVESLKALGRYDEIDTRGKMIEVMQKLPLFMQSRWRKEAVSYLERTGGYPGIEHLVCFIDKMAREQNDPIFGVTDVKPTKKDDNRNSDKKRTKGSSFNVQAKAEKPRESKTSTETAKQCFLCSGEHLMSNCKKLKELQDSDRLENVKQLRVCFNCLNGHHRARYCRQQVRCSCGKKHSELLHQALMDMYNDKDSAEKTDKTDAVKSFASAVDKGKVALPIVSVSVIGRWCRGQNVCSA